MNVKPLNDRILVKRFEAEEVAKGGIIIPDTAKEKPLQAEVISLGQGKKTEDGKILPFEVKVGDVVLIGKYAGQDLKLDGEDYLILAESDILGIVE